MARTNVESFKESFEAWLVCQEHYIDELLLPVKEKNHESSSEEDLNDRIARVLSHNRQYSYKK